MRELYTCGSRVTKRSCQLFVLLFFMFFALKAQGQDSSFVIVIPDVPLNYARALDTIEKQLDVSWGHEPNMPELLGPCCAHGRMSFGQFFEPLRKQGLYFEFIIKGMSDVKMLIIKRALPFRPVPVKPKTFGVWTVDEDAHALSSASIYDLDTRYSTKTDCSGMARVEYQEYPVELLVSYVGRRSVPETIDKDSTVVPLQIEPQSLEAVTFSYNPTKKAFSTSTFTAIQDVGIPYNGAYRRRLTDISTGTVQSMLEGRVPGVLVTPSSGVPGSSSYLTVRGQSSVINGTDPLYIIDGVPAAAGNRSVSNIQSGSAAGSLSPWSFIAPSDIERIDVLRDADATAIYGSRGANGIVLITTRQWKAGLPKWDVGFSSGISSVIRRPSFMNIGEYVGMRREALRNSGLADSTAPDLWLLDTTRNFDWGKWLLGRQARLTNAASSFSGGDIKNNYIAGMDYLRESTPFPAQPGHNRLTTNFNYNHQSLNRRWSLRFTGLSGWDANHQVISLDPASFQTLAPNAPSPLNKNGQLVFSSALNFPSFVNYANPLAQMRQPYESLSANYLLSMVNSYAIAKHLSFKTTAGFNRIHTQEYGAMPLSTQDPASSAGAMGYFASTRFDSRILEPEVDYTHKMGKLKTSFVGGASFQQLDEHASARTDTGYANDAALLHHEHATPIVDSSEAIRDVYMSYLGSLNCNWNNQYILELTGRRDGSSRYQPGHRFGNFGAVAFAWIFSSGDLLRRFLPSFSYGKLKVSEGVTGNDQMGDRTLQNIAGTSIQSFQSIPGLYPSSPKGKGWEKTYKTELSLDLGFLQNRILFNATAYRHRSDNFLPNPRRLASPSNSGPSGWPLVLQNSGYEFSLTGRLVENISFGWDVSVNWTIPQSKLISFPGLASTQYASRLVVGQSINVLNGYVYKGVDPQTGLYSFVDLDHDGQITVADQRVVGKFDAKGFGGLVNDVRWKQFQFQILLDARIATGVNYLAAVFANSPPGAIDDGLSSNVPRVLLDHWRQPGDNALYQKVTAAPDAKADSARGFYLSSSALLANTSFLRLRKVAIVYSLPSLRALRMHLTSLEFFLDAQNLFTLSRYGVDPEIQSVLTTPTMRTVEAGVRLSL